MTVESDGESPIDDGNQTVGPEEQTRKNDPRSAVQRSPDSTSEKPAPGSSPAEKQPADACERTLGPADATVMGRSPFDKSATLDGQSNETQSDSGQRIANEGIPVPIDPISNPNDTSRSRRPEASPESDLNARPDKSMTQTLGTTNWQPGTAPQSKDPTRADPEPNPDALDRPGSIGKYQIRRLLGQGAFGRVYEALDPQLNRLVAVKISKSLRGSDEVNRFLREARAAAHLRHPNIIPVFEYGQIDDQSIIVYELVEGETLRSYIKRNTPLPLTDTISIIRQIASGLDYAHQQGIIHRDIKPDNVLIDKKGQPHIADFGCARRSDDQDLHKTIEGSVLGTPMYMSPEQAGGRAHRADGRTDVWSLGVILYEMVSGEKPFQGKLSDVLYLIRHHDPIPLRKVQASTPRDIETICSRCLRRELDQRFPTAGELSDELDRFQRGEPILSRRVDVFQRTWMWAKRNRAVASLLTAVAMILLLGITISTVLWRQSVTAQRNHASTLMTQLQEAESSSLASVLEIILKNKGWSKNYMFKNMRDRLDTQPDPHKRLRLRMALLPLGDEQAKLVSSSKDQLIVDLLSADGPELLAFCQAFANAGNDDDRKNLTQILWSISTDSDWGSRQRFNAQCALALLDSDSDRWNTDYIGRDVAGFLTAMNIKDVQPWLAVVQPVSDQIKDNLRRIFEKPINPDDASPETAAAILAYNFKHEEVENEFEFMVDLIEQANARQLAHLLAAIEQHEKRQKIKDRLIQRWETDPSAVDRRDLKWVARKTSLTLALIRLKHSPAWTQVLRGPDNSVSTEVIELLEPTAIELELLLTEIEKWKSTNSDALAVVLLALGQFNDGQIPVSNRRVIILPWLTDIFKNHGDARVHSSARWLMTKWGFQSEVRQLENQPEQSGGLQRLWPAPGKNWHVDVNGNTFVVFQPGTEFEIGPGWKLPRGTAAHRFGICIHEVTNQQFQQFHNSFHGQETKMAESPAASDATGKPKNQETEPEDTLPSASPADGHQPAGKLDFFHALAYCRWLTDRTELAPSVRASVVMLEEFSSKKEVDKMGYEEPEKEQDWIFLENCGYRLPTVAEWKFACQAGTVTPRSFGINPSRLKEYAWYSSNADFQTHDVATLKPNEFGLFDMLGNVSEWCLDWYRNENGEKQKAERECRGGSYRNDQEAVQVSKNRSTVAIFISPDLGFRLARTYPPATDQALIGQDKQ